MFRFFEKLSNPFPLMTSEQPPHRLLAFCWYYTHGFRKLLLMLVVLSTLQGFLEVMLFSFLGDIVNWLGLHDRETFLRQEYPMLILMAFVVLIGLPGIEMLSSFVRNQTMMGNFPMALRWRFHHHLLGQSLSFYQDEFAGRVATKVMQTALALREFLLKTTDLFVYMTVYFVAILALLWQVNWLLMIPTLLWMILYAVMQWKFIPRLKEISRQQADARSMMTGRVVDAYTNIATVKLFAHGKRETAYVRASMNTFLQTVYRQFRFVTQIDIFLNILNYSLIFSTAAIGIGLWIQNAISPGALAMAIAMVLRLNGMSHRIIWEMSGLFEQLGTITDGMITLTHERLVQDKPNAPMLTVEQGRIEFDHVRFHYHHPAVGQEAIPAVLDNLNLHIQAGEKIGLVGRSGAGKSTLVNTLLRFYDIQSGSIKIDGQNIADVTQESLRQHIAMVTQDTSLLHRSVRENILYGRPDADETELMQAIHDAEADQFIANLRDPMGNQGLDAQVGERGVKLSGGQRQRIAIARVLLKNAPILILDEATSALDSEVEAAIQSSLNRLMEGKTVIAIAHRLSTIAAMDRLIVMDEGKIVESGTHEELLAQKGIYAQLWARQTGGYLGKD